jgi:hypothetical protein
MSLTIASTFAEKVRNIATAIVGCVTLFGFMMVPVGYYARAEMKEFVENFYEEKYAVGFRQWQGEQRQFRRDFERKLDKQEYEFKAWQQRQKEREELQQKYMERQLQLLEELNRKYDRRP